MVEAYAAAEIDGVVADESVAVAAESAGFEVAVEYAVGGASAAKVAFVAASAEFDFETERKCGSRIQSCFFSECGSAETVAAAATVFATVADAGWRER